MKKCIWCQTEEAILFQKKAHTFPKSLGGMNLCSNVCDGCNSYFGNPQYKKPAIEIVLKEFLNISKYLLFSDNKTPQKKHRYKSEYFNIDFTKKKISLKQRFNIQPSFQEKLGRLFRRGLYKVFLEERERLMGDALNERYNFIREFARYDIGDYPIYRLIPKYGIIMFSADMFNPELYFDEHSEQLDNNFRVYERIIMGHYFCMPTSKNFKEFSFERYSKHLISDNSPFGNKLIEIKYAKDIDFTFNYMNK